MIYISFWSTPSKVTQGQRCIRSEKSLLRLKKGVVLWGGGRGLVDSDEAAESCRRAKCGRDLLFN